LHHLLFHHVNSFFSAMITAPIPPSLILKILDLSCCQIAPLTRFEVAQSQGADPDAQDPHNGQSQLLARLTDLALAALSHDDAQPDAFALGALKADIHRLGLVPILENDTPPPGLELFMVRAARQENSIRSFMFVDTRQLC
jgi:hypothetical protein